MECKNDDGFELIRLNLQHLDHYTENDIVFDENCKMCKEEERLEKLKSGELEESSSTSYLPPPPGDYEGTLILFRERKQKVIRMTKHSGYVARYEKLDVSYKKYKKIVDMATNTVFTRNHIPSKREITTIPEEERADGLHNFTAKRITVRIPRNHSMAFKKKRDTLQALIKRLNEKSLLAEASKSDHVQQKVPEITKQLSNISI